MDDRINSMNGESVFTIEQVEKGIERYAYDISKLYASKADRDAFEARWDEFYVSDGANSDVFFRDGDYLIYYSQSLLPEIETDRLPLLLVFGNPAPHSIRERAIFSFEGDGREHRVWKVFSESGIVSFPTSTKSSNIEKSKERKKSLWEMTYKSPFLLGFVSYYSMPSTPSTEPWTGVSGLRRLFGSSVLQQIGVFEQSRMRAVIERFMEYRDGIVVTFQKDAYNGLRGQHDPVYKYDLAKAGKLLTKYQYKPGVKLFGAGPTRLIHSNASKAFLRSLVDEL